MTFQKFLKKIEETKLPICIKKVEKQGDKQFSKTEELIILNLPNLGLFSFSPASVSDIWSLCTENYSEWSIVFNSRGSADLTINKPVSALILIPPTSPDYQAVKDKWEGWNC